MTIIPEPETDFLLRRAEQESILAIRAGETLAGAAHYVMALRYSARAREALVRLRPRTVAAIPD
jgi:hypothetical protein